MRKFTEEGAASTKRCCRCKVERPTLDFYKSRNERDGFTKRCRDCQEASVVRGKRTVKDHGKRCPNCGQTRGPNSFYVDRKRADKLSVFCKKCSNDAPSRRRSAANDWRKAQRRYLYGLTETRFQEMVLAQKGLCAVCGRLPQDARSKENPILQVDHCHTTGKIRGLLCGSCNRAIGLMGEEPERLLSAAKYLLRRS